MAHKTQLLRDEPDPVSGLEVAGRSEDLVAARRELLRDILEFLETNGGGSRSEIMAVFLEGGAAGYETGLSAWKHLVQPGLSALAEEIAALESPGERGQRWSWSEPDNQEDLAELLEVPGESELDLKAARARVAAEFVWLVRRGLSPAQALDYWVTEDTSKSFGGLTQTAWALERDRTRQAISDSVVKARHQLID